MNFRDILRRFDIGILTNLWRKQGPNVVLHNFHTRLLAKCFWPKMFLTRRKIPQISLYLTGSYSACVFICEEFIRGHYEYQAYIITNFFVFFIKSVL